MDMNFNKKETEVPKYGFKVKLNHQYPEKWTQNGKLKLKQIWPLIPLAIR